MTDSFGKVSAGVVVISHTPTQRLQDPLNSEEVKAGVTMANSYCSLQKRNVWSQDIQSREVLTVKTAMNSLPPNLLVDAIIHQGCLALNFQEGIPEQFRDGLTYRVSKILEIMSEIEPVESLSGELVVPSSRCGDLDINESADIESIWSESWASILGRNIWLPVDMEKPDKYFMLCEIFLNMAGSILINR